MFIKYLNEKKGQAKQADRDEAEDFSNKIFILNHFFIFDYLNY
jgi:hypothetical protein